MEIWEEKYYSEQYGEETNASFNYFRRIITEFKPPFNLKTCAIKFVDEELEQKGITIVSDEQYSNISEDIQSKYISNSKYEKKINSRHKTLGTYSIKFAYQSRFEKYYDYFVEETQKNKLVLLSDWENGEFPLALKRTGFINDSLQKIHSDEDLTEEEKSRAELNNQKAYNEAVDTVYNMAHGGKKEYRTEHKGNMDFNHQVNKSIRDLEEEYEDYYNELQSELEGNQEENNNDNISE